LNLSLEEPGKTDIAQVMQLVKYGL